MPASTSSKIVPTGTDRRGLDSVAVKGTTNSRLRRQALRPPGELTPFAIGWLLQRRRARGAWTTYFGSIASLSRIAAAPGGSVNFVTQKSTMRR